ncbi:dihydroorotate dehydrogenase electron transfer subunit [Sedimentibacter acidaminivorans]|uniref:Dihydroorotate dehydrogenase B (NAD(+)), electron transfer subunit n=1 Tax=Sedimentibacter acidaminivorans TaxID=913099 RepID=A0ABS4GEZ9_9FIRM|nr:dihydroorotate dehydrogenase electron transfer subunit [Sedimentibacter acidaminivorans]
MKVQKSKILENKLISNKIYRLTVEFVDEIKPGQFFMLKTLDNSFLLPRPISINDVNDNLITLLYRVEGIGTTVVSRMKKGDEIQVFGPLGNGFDITSLKGKIAVIGGGIGIAPLLYLTKKIGKNSDVFLGYKDSVYIAEEFEKYSNNTIIVTEDGSVGKRGYVTDYVDFEKYDVVVTCGPEIMMNKIIDKCKEKKIKCYVSLERRMACGLGACLGCTVETVNGNMRACKDGPVFSSEELK